MMITLKKAHGRIQQASNPSHRRNRPRRSQNHNQSPPRPTPCGGLAV